MIQLIAIQTRPGYYVITTTDCEHKYGPDYEDIEKGLRNWIEDVGLMEARRELAEGGDA